MQSLFAFPCPVVAKSPAVRSTIPKWLDPTALQELSRKPDEQAVKNAMTVCAPTVKHFAALLSPAAAAMLEPMARRAEALTRRHFGRTISLYVPLYLSNYCPGGCIYCGFAADRKQKRLRLEEAELKKELAALKRKGFEEVLLLTGERTPEADFNYLRNCVALTAKYFHNVTIESFFMNEEEYRQLAEAGCTGMTLYQETYDPRLYSMLHRWGPKRDFLFRLEAPERALAGGLRTVGVGALLGLGDPIYDMIALFRHVEHLRKEFWQAGVSVSFPRLRPQLGDYKSPSSVDDKLLAQIIFAFRICLPDVPLVLSTRERPEFRDGMAGVGISKMSIASRTTVGGYHTGKSSTVGQFDVNDTRDVKSFCRMLRSKGLEPVFKNWDSAFR
jgi:2-iminoacetate synthase